MDKRFFAANSIISVGVLGFLGWLLLVRQPIATSDGLSFMPAVNATFNCAAALLIINGWFAIRRGAHLAHRRSMVAAFIASACFFVGYVAYHFVQGDTKYEGTGTLRTVYLGILASHVLLSMAVVPMALTAFYFAWRKRFDSHKKVTKILAPIWLYVSVTGVIIYFMLHGV